MTTTWLKSDKAHLERNIQLKGDLLAVEQRPVVLHPLVPPHPVEDTLQQDTQLGGGWRRDRLCTGSEWQLI
jgi:hypothetical protein